jgi:hypothetical protein
MAVSLPVSNVGDRFQCLFIEPLGEDYWMRPGARWRVVGVVDPRFEVAVMPGYLIVWINEGSVYDVRVVDEETGEELPCGDGRPAGFGDGSGAWLEREGWR